MADIFQIDYKNYESLIAAIKDYGDNAEDVINDVFEDYGTERVKEEITPLIHASGRRWKGHTKSAKNSQPFLHQMLNLGFYVRTKPKFYYLYFPDDGTNTRKHASRQQFMIRGAEKAAEDILERCLAKLTEL